MCDGIKMNEWMSEWGWLLHWVCTKLYVRTNQRPQSDVIIYGNQQFSFGFDDTIYERKANIPINAPVQQHISIYWICHQRAFSATGFLYPLKLWFHFLPSFHRRHLICKNAHLWQDHSSANLQLFHYMQWFNWF